MTHFFPTKKEQKMYSRNNKSARFLNKSGVTITEVLIASVIFIMVAGLAMALMTNTTNDFVKGEDTLTSVQDASALIMRLRQDLLNLSQRAQEATSETCDLFYWHKGESSTIGAQVQIFATSGTVKVDNALPTVNEEAKTVFSFWHYVKGDGSKEKITYAYKEDEMTIVRQVHGGPVKKYAIPRLKDFRISFLCQAKEKAEELQAFKGSVISETAISQMWFAAKITVQSDESLMRRRTTKIDIESRIFPRGLNRKFTGRWTRAN